MSNLPPINGGVRPQQESEAEPTRLARKLAQQVRADGPMTFRAFMERALYEPGEGYYSRPYTAWEESGDFVTAPQVDAALGVATAALARECDKALDEPPRFDLIEFGGGDGALLRDVCDAIETSAPSLYQRLRVSSIERGSASRDQQMQRLQRHASRLSWFSHSQEIEPGSRQGLAVSNELLDAFPVHRVVWRCGALREIYVDVGENGFVEREGPPSVGELVEYLERNRISLREGQVAEICLGVRPWVNEVTRLLQRGFVLTVDYGVETASLYGDTRPRGSLVCQYRYQQTASPFERVGRQDMTAHVDFGNLRRCGIEAGLEDVGSLSLAAFLVGFGAAAAAALPADGADVDAAAIRRHLGLRHLLFTEIGDAHRAVLQRKGVGPIEFSLDRLTATFRQS